MHLGLDADAEVNGETTQFAACASGRLMNFILRDTIPKHLQRNAMIAKSEQAAKNAHHALSNPSVKKRPAAKPSLMIYHC